MFARPSKKLRQCTVSAALVMTLVGVLTAPMAKAASVSASDILWHNSATGESQLWFMGGSKISSRATVLGENGSPAFVGLPWSIVGAGRFNTDQTSDIVWHNSATGETQFWAMFNQKVSGRATVLGESGSPAFIGPPFSIVGVGDFYGDQADDILWHNSATGETQIWFMGGNRVSSRATVLGENGTPAFVGLPWSIVGVGKFNPDQTDDILWYNSATGETQIWAMRGYRVIGRATVLGQNGSPAFIGPPFGIVGAGDFNKDGKADIVWHNSATGETQIWLMDGARLSSRATVLFENGSPALIGAPWSIVGIKPFTRDQVPAGPKTVHFHEDVTTQDWAPIGGSIDIDVNANGDFTFSGHMRDSGFLNIHYALVAMITTPSTDVNKLGGLPFAHEGAVDGTITLFGRNREDNWSITGNKPEIAAHWGEISQGRLFWRLQAQDTLSGGLEGLIEDTAKDAVKALAKAAVEYLIKAVIA
jgi:hypothetical protein